MILKSWHLTMSHLPLPLLPLQTRRIVQNCINKAPELNSVAVQIYAHLHRPSVFFTTLEQISSLPCTPSLPLKNCDPNFPEFSSNALGCLQSLLCKGKLAVNRLWVIRSTDGWRHLHKVFISWSLRTFMMMASERLYIKIFNRHNIE